MAMLLVGMISWLLVVGKENGREGEKMCLVDGGDDLVGGGETGKEKEEGVVGAQPEEECTKRKKIVGKHTAPTVSH